MSNQRAPRRGKARRQHDIYEVGRMYVEAVPLPTIAEKLGITYVQVESDIRVIKRHWRMTSVRNFDEARSRELAKLDHLETTYWDAWFRSQRDQEETVAEISDGTVNRSLKRVKRRTGITGDAVYLTGVGWCIDRRCRILGLDAPMRVTVDAVRAEAERLAAATGFSVDEIIAEAQSIVNAAY